MKQRRRWCGAWPYRRENGAVVIEFGAGQLNQDCLSSLGDQFSTVRCQPIRHFAFATMSLVRELRDGIVDAATPASVVLRKAKILAATLHEPQLGQWLSNELDGYSSFSDLPSYRKLHLPLLGNFAGPRGFISNYLIPITLLPEPLNDRPNDVPMAQPLREIEASAAAANDTVRSPLPAEAVLLVRERIRLTGNFVLVELYHPLTKATFEGLIDSVRNRLLDFLLGLQEINSEVLDSETRSPISQRTESPRRLTFPLAVVPM